MRTMLRARLNVDAANLAIADGSIGPTLDRVFAACRPEATYFLTESGRRTIYAIFDLASPDIVPVIAEPLFHAFGAEVDFHPVMVAADLEKGLASWTANR